MKPPVGKSGPWTVLEDEVELFVAAEAGGVDQVMMVALMISVRLCGRDVGRHADGDAGAAVDDEVGVAWPGRTVGSSVDSS